MHGLQKLFGSKGREHVDLFTSWCEKKSVNFDITPEDHFLENKGIVIFTAIVSCMSASKMKGSLLFLTPEQINVLHSKEKHVVIDCPNGCGKQLIGRNKAKMIADNLPEKELLYKKSCNSRIALLDEIQRSNPRIKIHSDEEE